VAFSQHVEMPAAHFVRYSQFANALIQFKHRLGMRDKSYFFSVSPRNAIKLYPNWLPAWIPLNLSSLLMPFCNNMAGTKAISRLFPYLLHSSF
jgi:hypothetical protein